MTCRDQWEEKKLPWISNIFANAVFSNDPPEAINRVIMLAERMSYQQICALALIGMAQAKGGFVKWMFEPPGRMTRSQGIAYTAVRELFDDRIGLIDSGRASLTGIGRLCFDLMSLRDYPHSETEKVSAIFPDHKYLKARLTKQMEYAIQITDD